MRLRRLVVGLFLVSLTGLGYEIVLTRIFSLAEWYHFAYMIISMAMFGFAAAGTVFAVVPLASEKRIERLIVLVTGLLVVTLPVCYGLSQFVPYETLELINQPVQVVFLSVLYLLLSVPFFLVSAVLVLVLKVRSERVGLLYSANLLGSGVGALGAVSLMFYYPPSLIVYLLMLPPSASLFVFGVGNWADLLMVAGFLAFCFLTVLVTGVVEVKISPYKPLSSALRAPRARIVDTAYSPLSTVHALASPQMRESPGQISGYPFSRYGGLPEQIGLFIDGSGPTVINEADSPARLENFTYLDYVTGALPYKLRTPETVAVLGAGGGTGLWNALYHDAEEVLALEVDPGIVELMNDEFSEFSGHLYQRSDVKAIEADARGYMESHRRRYDLIQFSMTQSFSTASAGVHGLSESYLFTVEAFETYLERLTPNGMIAVTRWINTPPRGSLRMVATMIEAAREAGLPEPGEHLAAVRSWNTITIVLSRSPIREDQVDAVRSFSRTRSFDRVYHPGLAEESVNRFIRLREPVFYRATVDLLRNPELFYDRYVYSVRPTRDNRPYFNHYFKWDSIGDIVRQLGTRTVRFVNWGYLLLLLTLVQALPVSVLLLLIPFLTSGESYSPGTRFLSALYFVLIGLGFMFLEIAYLQIFMQFLSYPVYSVAVVLTGFLVFSGLGSYGSELVGNISAPTVLGGAIGVLVPVVLIYSLVLDAVFVEFVGLGDPGKITLALLLLLPLALPLGIPFPVGLRLASGSEDNVVPLAWAANGCGSVLGSVLAMVFAVHFGFQLVIGFGITLYVLAGSVLFLHERRTQS